MKRRYCKHVMCWTCMKHRQCQPCERRERLCAAECLIQSNLPLRVSQTPPLCRDASPPPPLGDAVVVPMKTACMHAEQIIIIFYIFIFIFCSIIIIIIIKRGWQCKAGRERLTPYQSEEPNLTTPTRRKKEEKGKTVGDKK